MKINRLSKFVRTLLSTSLLLATISLSHATPERVPSFGPNGTHWPDLIPTPFLYDVAAHNIEVPASWSAIEAAVEGLTDQQVSEGVRILVQPGSISGKGSSSSAQSVVNTMGKTSWTKRVTICPRDGYGSVVLSGGHKFTRVYNTCIAGFINTGGYMLLGCDGASIAWSKTNYIKTISDSNPVSKVEFVEVVIPDAEVDNGDVSQVGAHTHPVSGFRWDGCYFAPHYYVNNTTPRPHTDTLQFYKSGANWNNWNMTIRDTAIFGSNNAALQTGGVDGIDIVHSYLVNGNVSLSRYPVPSGGETDELSVAINGAGQNWTAVDSLMSGSAALSNPSGLFSNQPFSVVSNSTVSFGSSGYTVPKSGSWTRNTTDSFYIDAMPQYPTDEYLSSIWSGAIVADRVSRPVFTPSGGVYDSDQAVAITSLTPGATIYYTTDGSAPDSGANPYTTPLTISADTILRAIAINGVLDESETRTADFLFKASEPTIAPADAFSLESVIVTILSATPGAAVYYTLDGSVPDGTDLLYSGPFTLASTATVKAVAVHPELDASEIATSQITIGEFIMSSLQWENSPVSPQDGLFAVLWDSIPDGNFIDGVTGISSGEANGWADLACIVRFAPSGNIDVRNGGGYSADSVVSYTAGTRYSILCIVDIANKRYDVTVTPEGGSAVKIADDYLFRSEQAGLTEITNLAIIAPDGSHRVEVVAIINTNTPRPSPTGFRQVATEE